MYPGIDYQRMEVTTDGNYAMMKRYVYLLGVAMEWDAPKYVRVHNDNKIWVKDKVCIGRYDATFIYLSLPTDYGSSVTLGYMTTPVPHRREVKKAIGEFLFNVLSAPDTDWQGLYTEATVSPPAHLVRSAATILRAQLGVDCLPFFDTRDGSNLPLESTRFKPSEQFFVPLNTDLRANLYHELDSNNKTKFYLAKAEVKDKQDTNLVAGYLAVLDARTGQINYVREPARASSSFTSWQHRAGDIACGWSDGVTETNP